MKHAILLTCLLSLISIFSAGPGNAQAEPADLHSWCAAHPEYPGPGENGTDNLGVLAWKRYSSTWRCMDGKVMVCDLGATGFGCMKIVPIDSGFRKRARQFCQSHYNDDFIPMSLVAGYGSEWRCNGTTPVATRFYSLDKDRYLRGDWKVLPVKPTPALIKLQTELLASYHGDVKTIDKVANNADYAALAANVYGGDNPYPLPKDWKAVGDGPVKISNIGTGDLIYETYENSQGQYVLAFQGTTELRQWLDNIAGQVLPTALSFQVESVANQAVSEHPNVVFVGHSLGGRLANFARLMTGNDAVIFDASTTSAIEHLAAQMTDVTPGHLTSFRSPQDPVSGMAPLRGDIVVENMPRVSGMSTKQKVELDAVALGLKALGPYGEAASKLVKPLAEAATVVGEAQTYTHNMDVLAGAMRSASIVAELTDLTQTQSGATQTKAQPDTTLTNSQPDAASISHNPFAGILPRSPAQLFPDYPDYYFTSSGSCNEAGTIITPDAVGFTMFSGNNPFQINFSEFDGARFRGWDERNDRVIGRMTPRELVLTYPKYNNTTTFVQCKGSPTPTKYRPSDASGRHISPFFAKPVPTNAHPSYDCAKASHPDEYAICQTPRLSFYDSEVARRYIAARKVARGEQRKFIIKEQQAWLEHRHMCGGDTICLTYLYVERLGALSRYAGHPKPPTFVEEHIKGGLGEGLTYSISLTYDVNQDGVHFDLPYLVVNWNPGAHFNPVPAGSSFGLSILLSAFDRSGNRAFWQKTTPANLMFSTATGANLTNAVHFTMPTWVWRKTVKMSVDLIGGPINGKNYIFLNSHYIQK